MAMGRVYAQLIYDYQMHGVETRFKSLADVPNKYKEFTRQAYWDKFGLECPETDPKADTEGDE